jgi:hypothetical protein
VESDEEVTETLVTYFGDSEYRTVTVMSHEEQVGDEAGAKL